MPRKHVADVDEMKRLLPEKFWNTDEAPYEFVWLVNEDSGQIETGTCVNTELSLYFDFVVERINNEIVDFKAVTIWLPCTDPED